MSTQDATRSTDMTDQLDPRTPILVGVGQTADPIDSPDYRRMSAVELAAEAARIALDDAGVDPASVDTVAGVRQFEISTPRAEAPLGRSDNYPRSVARRIGADPRRAVLEVAGGQSPQHLITEFAGAIARGEAETVVVFGSEAISTTRALAGREDAPDFTETIGGQLEDRGFGLEGLTSRAQVEHGLTDAPSQYALFDNARRGREGVGRDAYAREIGELFAPFTEVAAGNPYAAARTRRDADELMTVTAQNRMIADPYPRFVVARDQVNQGAAVVLTSVGHAREAGIPEDRWVFVHGHADRREKDLLDRPDLSSSPAAVAAATAALDQAGIASAELTTIDLYSCFAIAVLNVVDGLGLAIADPRGLTLTGGLPFFGGAGNNYSMHAVAETVVALRARPGAVGFVGANGGVLSKYSAAVYSTTPAPWREGDDAAEQARLDAVPSVPVAEHPNGVGTIETYTVKYDRAGRRLGIIVGRTTSGERFLATVPDGDDATLDLLTGGEPFGAEVHVRSSATHAFASVDESVADRSVTAPTSVSPPASRPGKALPADPDSAELLRLLDAQREAFLEEGPPSAAVRRDRIDRLTLAVLDHATEIAAALDADFGNRPVPATFTSDILGALGDVAETLEHLDEWMEPEPLPGSAEKGIPSVIQRRPKGVVGVIGPWNFPVNLVFQPAMEALAAGNRVMIKFSEVPSRTADVFAEAVADVFDPTELVVVRGGPATAAAFSALPFDHLFFTGSPAVGSRVAEAAGRNLVPVTLELGGKNPVVVAPGTDLTMAAERIAASRLANGGQICLCPDYVFVPRERVDGFTAAYRTAVTRFYPDWFHNPDVVTTVNAANFDRVNGLVDDAEERGAVVVRIDSEETDPRPDAATRRIPPTLVVGVTEDMAIAHDEVFGPVLGVMPYDSVDEATAWVQRQPSPLAAYWYGDEDDDFREFIRRTTSGGLTRNDMALHFGVQGAPFGGVGRSGTGAYHGKTGFDTFSHQRTITQSALPFGVAVTAAPPWPEDRAEQLVAAARAAADTIRARLEDTTASTTKETH
jgi:acyl-CoA reductase-like NAD-dependent aldehyde dehydrogenase